MVKQNIYLLIKLGILNHEIIVSLSYFCFFQMPDLRSTEGTQYSSHPQMTAMRPRVQPGDIRQSGMIQHGQLTTINQSQLSGQLGLNMGANNVPHNSPSPPGSKSATPSPSSSVHEDEGDETSKVQINYLISFKETMKTQGIK